jgi:ATP-dependent protease ClpP protease subunit
MSDENKILTFNIGNKIYFNGDIDTENVNKFVEILYSISDIDMINLESKTIELRIHINSYGGYLHEGIRLMEIINAYKKIYTDITIIGIVNSICYSAAVMLLLTCDKRYIGKFGSIMIHQSHYGYTDYHHQNKAYTDFSENLMNKKKEFILSKTKINKEQLEEAMKTDLWMDCYNALELGFVDEITD